MLPQIPLLYFIMKYLPLLFLMVCLCGAQPIQPMLTQYLNCRRKYCETVSSTPLFDSPQILRLNDLFKLQVTSFDYECLSNLDPVYFRDYFTSIHSIHSIGTRQSKKGDLYAIHCNTTQHGLRFIHYSGVRIWNSLPADIRESHSLTNFKKKLKDYFFATYKI